MSSYKTKHQHHVCIVYCDQHVSLPTCKFNVTWRYRDFFVTLRTFMNKQYVFFIFVILACSAFNPYTYWIMVSLRTFFLVTSYQNIIWETSIWIEAFNYFSAHSHGYTIYETMKLINKPINFLKPPIYLCILDKVKFFSESNFVNESLY